MQLDRPEGQPDGKVTWGSDIAAQMLRRSGIPYVSLNPGASYRGLHDSLVNHLGNTDPGILLCLHEDHSVAIAHGYAKATGEPMACVLHSNVGLLHGMMSLYNAWCDRAPMIVLGATGPLDAEKRRPWIDWIHTSRDQGGLVRSFIKWDDQPSSGQALVESMCRANIATRAAPTAPVYICLDAGLQEQRLDKEPEWPDMTRFTPPAPSRPARSAVDQAAGAAQGRAAPGDHVRPRLARCAGLAAARQARRAARRLRGDRPQARRRVPDRPSGALPCRRSTCSASRRANCCARPTSSWRSTGSISAARCGRRNPPARCRPRSSARRSTRTCIPAPTWSTSRCRRSTCLMATTGDVVVEDLIEALGPGRKEPWKVRVPSKPRAANGGGLTMEHIASTLRSEFNDPENVSFCTLGRGWPIDIWPFQSGMSYLGKDGGGGLGSGPGLSVGSALALAERGRYAISMLGDGDFCMGVTAIWTAVRHRIPLLVLINNNRSYFNDELHQETVAKTRGREVKNRWIGLRMEDPAPDIAKLAEAQGAVGIGPVTSAADAKAAISKGVAVLKSGGVCVIDFHVEPPADRSDGIGHRAT